MFDDVTFKIFILSLIITLRNKLIVKRDYFAQKVLYFFMNFHLKSSFQNFIIVNMRFIDNQKRMMKKFANGNITSN